MKMDVIKDKRDMEEGNNERNSYYREQTLENKGKGGLAPYITGMIDGI